jgi:hypothetical protein
MNHPPSLSSVACFDGTTQRFIYISLLGSWNIVRIGFVWGSCWQQRVVFTKNCYRRSEVYLFIYFLSFFLVLFFSPLRACRGWFIRRARLCRKTSFILPWLDELPKSHYKTEFGTWQHPFFSLSYSVDIFCLCVCPIIFLLSISFSWKPQIDFCIPFLASAASLQTDSASWFVPNYTVVCVCVYKGAIVSIFNMRTISLSLITHKKRCVCFFVSANVQELFHRFASRRVCVFSGRSSPAFSPLTNSHRFFGTPWRHWRFCSSEAFLFFSSSSAHCSHTPPVPCLSRRLNFTLKERPFYSPHTHTHTHTHTDTHTQRNKWEKKKENMYKNGFPGSLVCQLLTCCLTCRINRHVSLVRTRTPSWNFVCVCVCLCVYDVCNDCNVVLK